MWCWRCGLGSICQRRLHRRSKFQQDNLHTLLLWERQRKKGFLSCCYCGRQSNLYQNKQDSRTDYFLQTNIQGCFHPFGFLYKQEIYKPVLSTPPPNNSDRSDCFYTATEGSLETSLDEKDMVGAQSLLSFPCCCQPVWWICGPCLCPPWVHRHLIERRMQQVITKHICWLHLILYIQLHSVSSVWIFFWTQLDVLPCFHECKWVLTFPQTRFQPLLSTVVQSGWTKQRHNKTSACSLVIIFAQFHHEDISTFSLENTFHKTKYSQNKIF